MHIPKNTDLSNFKFNAKYFTDLTQIFKNNNTRTSYLYNQKSGLTLSLLQILEARRKFFGCRYLYFNSEYINKYSKKYFYFRMAKLFKEEEEKLYLDIFEKKEGENISFDEEYIVNKINKVLEKKLGDIYIIIDNIKEPNNFTNAVDLISKIKPNKFITYFFIAINSSSMNIIDNIKLFSPKIISLFPNDDSKEQILPPEQFFELNSKNQKDYNMDSYFLKIKSNLNSINENTFDYFIFLIKLIYNEAASKNNTFSIANYYRYLEKILNYIYISINTDNMLPSISKIKFRTNHIKNIN